VRLRTDSGHVAGWKRVHELLGCSCSPEILAESAKPSGERNEACPSGVHFWTHGHDCGDRSREHVSCWTWTGSPDDGTLSAQPSLWVVPDLGGCGWHGFLTNGEMVPA
jgi:hypothetical protein